VNEGVLPLIVNSEPARAREPRTQAGSGGRCTAPTGG
jgi:hypothetical protein